MEVPKKTYYQTDKAVNDSLRLARLMYDKGVFDPGDEERVPNAFVGIWRGGTFVANFVTGAMEGYGIRHHTYSIAGKSYAPDEKTGIGSQTKGIKIYNMEEVVWYLREHGYATVCLIDEIVDTGRTQHSVRRILRDGLKKSDAIHVDEKEGHAKCTFRMNAGKDTYALEVRMSNDEIPPLNPNVRVLMAVTHWKKAKTVTGEEPDIYIEEISPTWKVYPWEASSDCKRRGELKDHYPEFWKILHG